LIQRGVLADFDKIFDASAHNPLPTGGDDLPIARFPAQPLIELYPQRSFRSVNVSVV
jgi:hypothetical protein